MDIIPVPKKNLSLDATTLTSLMGCGRYTDLRFNHRFTSSKGKSNSLEVGNLIHKVFEVYYRHLINGFKKDVAIGQALAAGQLFVTGCPYCASVIESESLQCGHEPGEYPGMTNTPEQSVKWDVGWRFALDTCEKYFKHYESDSFIPLAAEHVKKEVIYEDDEIRVLWKAKFDLTIDTNQIGIVSMDHKTFKQRRDKTTLNNQFSGHCILLNSRNVIVNKIGLQSSLDIKERLTREVVSYSADRLDEWRNEIVPYYAYKYIQFSESNYWPPNYAHCDNMFGPCMFKSVCEANRTMREEVLQNEYMIGPVWDPKNREGEE